MFYEAFREPLVLQRNRTITEPFDPPQDYVFEPELQAERPRPIPWRVKWSPQRQQLVAGSITCAIPPAMYLAAYYTEPFLWVGQYFPLFHYVLPPITFLVLLCLGFAIWEAIAPISPEDIAMIQRGVPQVARITRLKLVARCWEGNKPVSGVLAVQFEFIHPTTNELCRSEDFSEEIPIWGADVYANTLTVGEYVTVISWEDQPETHDNPRLYRLRNHHPDHALKQATNLVRSTWRESQSYYFWVFVGLWSCVAMSLIFRYFPLSHSRELCVGALMSINMTATIFWVCLASQEYHERERFKLQRFGKDITESNLYAGVILDKHPSYQWWKQFGWAGGGAIVLLQLTIVTITPLAVLMSINAWFDDSPEVQVPIFISRDERKAEKPLLAQIFNPKVHIVHYKFSDEFTNTFHWHAIYEDPKELFPNSLGIAVIREGYFGWTWVQELRRTNSPHTPRSR